jgi:flavin-dependent thymidylate synthase
MNNTCELIGYYGGDRRIAQSAWCSTNREMTEEKITRIPKLLQMLRDGSDGHPHGTPFEKSLLHFVIKTDIATHIHILKHRINVSTNAESARYKELKADSAFIPEDWPKQWQTRLREHAAYSFELYHQCLDSLVNEYGFDKKRAKESSRFFNPYATQLVADVSFNFRSFTHFCQLRNAPGAQKEVRDLARQMIQQVDAIRSPYKIEPGDMDAALGEDMSPFHYSLRVWGLI